MTSSSTNSGYICHESDADVITVCSEHNVCSPKRLNPCKSHSSNCSSANAAAPFNNKSSLSTVSSTIISVQQSLLVLINSHLLQLLWKSSINLDITDPWLHSHRLTQQLVCLFQKVGYVSNRFFASLHHSIRIFFEYTTFTSAPRDLPQLSSIASHFGAQLRSIALTVRSPLVGQDIATYAPTISEVTIHIFCLRNFDFLLQSSSFFFSSIKLLKVFVTHVAPFDLFCQCLSNNSIVDALSIEFVGLGESHAGNLADVFSTNRTLKKVQFSLAGLPPSYDDVQCLFDGISKNNVIECIDIVRFPIKKSSLLLGLIGMTSLKCLLLPGLRDLDSRVFKALSKNSSLREVTVTKANFVSEEVESWLTHNTFLKKLELRQCSASISPLFKYFGLNSSILELTLSGIGIEFNNQEVNSFIEMLQANSTVSLLNLDGSCFDSSKFKTVLKVLETNTSLRKVHFPFLNLSCLITMFEPIITEKLRSLVDVSPHSIDFSRGLICYENDTKDVDLVSLLKALKSNIPIKRVDCELKSPNLAGIITLFEIFSINNSVVDVDIFPHVIDSETGVFRYTPKEVLEITTSEITSIGRIFNSFQINELTLTNSIFTEETITSLCGVITVDNSLTSVDLNSCKLSDSHLSILINAIPSNSNLKILNLNNTTIGLNGLLTIFEFGSTNKSAPIVDCYPHSIDYSLGLIRYEGKIDSRDLVSLSTWLKSNLSINCVEFNGLVDLSFEAIIVLFEILMLSKSVINHHDVTKYVDLSTGDVKCPNFIENADLALLLQSLMSSIPINRVKCLGLRTPNLEGLTSLFEIHSINSAIIDLDVSPHSLSVENGVFVIHQTL
ncbi:hypothetical protein GEMRC1_013521 [Eukaryota sp. GEM-RC1]